LELLKQDHQNVKQLFEQCQAAKDKKQQKQIFKESLVEHKQVKTVLREMFRLSPSSERFKPKFKVLKDDVEHHAS